MPKPRRTNIGGLLYHVLNRANARMPIFEGEGDYAAFLRIVAEAHEKVPMRLLDYCLMPNHWHFVMWPHRDGDLSRFMHWLTLTHATRWQTAHQVIGMGHLYGSRFKNFPVEDDRYYLTVCRYVVRNPLRAGLVNRAEEWPWSSLHQRLKGINDGRPPLTDGPLAYPDNWLDVVNTRESEEELKTLRRCVHRGIPFGKDSWVALVARQMGIPLTPRPRGRPRKTDP